MAASSPTMLKAVLAAEVTRDDIDDAMARCELHLTNVVPASGALPAQLIYTMTAASHAYLIEDARLGLVYVAATGPEAETIVGNVRRELPCVEEATSKTLEALLTAAAPDAIGVLRALGAAVLCAPQSPDTNACLTRALGHQTRDVRLAGLVAATYGPSRALYAPLTKIRDEDDDGELRAQAARLLDAILGAA